MLTDVQTPFLGTPLVPLKHATAVECRRQTQGAPPTSSPHLSTSLSHSVSMSVSVSMSRSTPLRLYASTPLRLYASTPLRLYVSTSLRLDVSTSLRLDVYCEPCWCAGDRRTARLAVRARGLVGRVAGWLVYVHVHIHVYIHICVYIYIYIYIYSWLLAFPVWLCRPHARLRRCMRPPPRSSPASLRGGRPKTPT